MDLENFLNPLRHLYTIDRSWDLLPPSVTKKIKPLPLPQQLIEIEKYCRNGACELLGYLKPSA